MPNSLTLDQMFGLEELDLPGEDLDETEDPDEEEDE